MKGEIYKKGTKKGVPQSSDIHPRGATEVMILPGVYAEDPARKETKRAIWSFI
jgi:hypothetical protein